MITENAPLAERMRPQNLNEYVGQQHLVGIKGSLRKALDAGVIPSLLLWGPPGVGKTTLAQIIANTVNAHFYTISAVSAGVKEVREIIDRAKLSGKTILFIDEIHRFSKSQQDALLGAVEKGVIKLIGATTENPSFEVNKALLSRCQVYTLKLLTKEELIGLLKRAIENDIELKKIAIDLKETDALIELSGGDARRLLNLLEMVVQHHQSDDVLIITDEHVAKIAQQNPLHYDKKGDNHYDVISAFIKSIRGSDPDGAVYWLARMIESGEDALFIARRLVILASEDIGHANPTALIMATNAFQALQLIGMPEGRIILSQATTYLACSPKSNSSYMAINKAQDVVRQTGNLPVPLHLRGAYTQLNKEMGYGKGYKYAHDYTDGFVHQQYLPDGLNEQFYLPKDNPRENEFKKWLTVRWKDKKYK